jgi:photosystem II stability/assembly factor-like uncharacterized protein
MCKLFSIFYDYQELQEKVQPKGTCMKKAPVRISFSIFMLIVFSLSAHAQWSKTAWEGDNSYFNLYMNRNTLLARTWDCLDGGRMFITTDNGSAWNRIASADTDIDILSVVMLDNTILAGTWNGFYQSTTNGASWSAITPSGIPTDIAIWSIAKMADMALFAGATGDIFKSSDNGNTWSDVRTGIPASVRITSIVESGSAILAGSDSSGVFMTTNGGGNWSAVNSGLSDLHILQLSIAGAKIFAVTLKGVFVSYNTGTSWAADGSDLGIVNCMLAFNNQLFAGTDRSGIFVSTDNGATWTQAGSLPVDTRVWSFAANGSSIFAGTSSGVWRMSISSELGDVNGDSRIDIVDALLIAQYYVGINPAGFNPANADVNCSGAIDIVDALLVAQYYVGLISSLPCR